MMWLGTAKAEEEAYPLHNPRFNPDEKCIPVGVKAMSSVIFDYLNMKKAGK